VVFNNNTTPMSSRPAPSFSWGTLSMSGQFEFWSYHTRLNINVTHKPNFPMHKACHLITVKWMLVIINSITINKARLPDHRGLCPLGQRVNIQHCLRT